MALAQRIRGAPPPSPLDGLLQPIAPDRPTGSDQRYGAGFANVAELRRADQAFLPRGVWQVEAKRADWPGVAAACTALLETETKDLRLAAWLVEAWIHRDGFAGLEPGLALLEGLSARFWADLHPALEDGDLDARMAPLAWLASQLPPLLRSLPLTASAGDSGGLGHAAIVNAERLEVVRQRDRKAAERSEARGAVTVVAVAAALASTSDAVLEHNAASLRRGRAALGRLESVLLPLAGADLPSLRGIDEALLEILAFVEGVLDARAPPVPASPPAGPAAILAPVEPASPAGRTAVRPGAAPPIADREAALAHLEQIALFLRRTEPHSPVPLLVERAVAWGRMPLAELAAELTRGGRDMPALFELIGLSRREEGARAPADLNPGA